MSRISRARVAAAGAAKAYLCFISASRAAESSKNSRALPPISGCARFAARL